MKICIPIDQLNGLESEISPNFRAAQILLLIDSRNKELQVIDASAGSCGAMPQQLDVIVCAGGMGRGMFNGLRSRGVHVFNTDALTVAEALDELASGKLEEVTEVECCGGGHHGHEAGHEHAKGEGCGCSGGHHGEKQGGCCSQH